MWRGAAWFGRLRLLADGRSVGGNPRCGKRTAQLAVALAARSRADGLPFPGPSIPRCRPPGRPSQGSHPRACARPVSSAPRSQTSAMGSSIPSPARSPARGSGAQCTASVQRALRQRHSLALSPRAARPRFGCAARGVPRRSRRPRRRRVGHVLRRLAPVAPNVCGFPEGAEEDHIVCYLPLSGH
jgi:hypothetical protein